MDKCFELCSVTLCWAARCDATFKIMFLGCSPGSIDVGCEHLQTGVVTFYTCPNAETAEELMDWLESRMLVDFNAVFKQNITTEEKKLMGRIFFLYYKYFIGGSDESPMLQMREGPFGTGVFANRDIAKGERLVIGYLDRSPVSDKKLEAMEKIGCLTTCKLEGENYAREICGPIRYINHSCLPNCHTEDFETLEVQRNIKDGEELFIYYFDNSCTDEIESFQCKCNWCIKSTVDRDGEE